MCGWRAKVAGGREEGRTREGHLAAELLLEVPEVHGVGNYLVDVLAEGAVRDLLVLYLLVRLRSSGRGCLKDLHQASKQFRVGVEQW